MIFAPLELCKKLSALGCKSDCSFAWFYRDSLKPSYFTEHESKKIGQAINEFHTVTQAFIYQDFIGPSEQAIENARLVFGRGLADECPACQSTGCELFNDFYYRHILIYTPEADFWPTIESALK